MTEKAELPLRAEDAVAKLKRSREQTVSPDAEHSNKRAKTTEQGPGPTDKPDSVLSVSSTSVLDGVAHFPRRCVGSVVYCPNKLLLQGHELQFNGVLQVKIGHEFLKRPESLKTRAVWGTDVYTDDTDLVAALHHLGHLDASQAEHKNKDLCVELLVLPPLQQYKGSLRNGLNSRTWLTRHDGVSYMVLGKPKPMPLGWAHSGKELLYERYEALKELRHYDPRNIAYV